MIAAARAKVQVLAKVRARARAKVKVKVKTMMTNQKRARNISTLLLHHRRNRQKMVKKMKIRKSINTAGIIPKRKRKKRGKIRIQKKTKTKAGENKRKTAAAADVNRDHLAPDPSLFLGQDRNRR